MSSVSHILQIVESLAPSYLKHDNDKVGLQIGDPRAKVTKLLVTLEITPEVFKEAKDMGVELIVSHHPLIFRSLDRIRTDEHIGKMIAQLLSSGISVIVAHTNLDRAKNGVNDALAHTLDLQNIEVLAPASDIEMFKLAVYVPDNHVDRIVQAIGNAGGGVIGDYNFCTFRSNGIGTFYPMKGAQPYSGNVEQLNEVNESRVEASIAPNKLDRVIAAVCKAHPYEEVVYDIFQTKVAPRDVGFGRIGSLATAKSLRDCVEAWSQRLGSNLRVSGDWNLEIERVAVCGGSGGDLMSIAKASGADVYVTGDIKHHAAHSAREMGLAIIDAGHAETERLIIPNLARELKRSFDQQKLEVDVIMSAIDTSPWNKS